MEDYTPGDDIWVSFEVLAGGRSQLLVYALGGHSNGARISVQEHIANNSAGDGEHIANNSAGDGFRFSATANGNETFLSGSSWENIKAEYDIDTNGQGNTKIPVWILGKSSPTPVSSIIISDEAISPRERVAILPMTSISTDMTAGGDGLYTATALNQTLLQTPDTTALATLHGGTSVVTGIQVVAKPAYKTVAGMGHLTAISKHGALTTEHFTKALVTDSEAFITGGYSLPNITLNDLLNYQFGWKAVE